VTKQANKRRWRLLVAVVAVLAFALAAGTAFAGTAPIEKNNSDCGVDDGGTNIGTMTATRTGASVTFTYDVTTAPGLDASDDYDITLWRAKSHGNCEQVGGSRGTLSTDGSGLGSFTFSTNLASGSYFVTAHNGNGYNDSLIVDLTVASARAQAAPAGAPSGIFLCYSKFQMDPGVWGEGTAPLLLAAGYWLPYAIAGNVDDGTNVGGYHLTCNLTGTQKTLGGFVDGAGEMWPADTTGMTGLYPLAG
jgi:hypothetical protein